MIQHDTARYSMIQHDTARYTPISRIISVSGSHSHSITLKRVSSGPHTSTEHCQSWRDTNGKSSRGSAFVSFVFQTQQIRFHFSNNNASCVWRCGSNLIFDTLKCLSYPTFLSPSALRTRYIVPNTDIHILHLFGVRVIQINLCSHLSTANAKYSWIFNNRNVCNHGNVLIGEGFSVTDWPETLQTAQMKFIWRTSAYCLLVHRRQRDMLKDHDMDQIEKKLAKQI
jgi:hypothetical protein